MLKDHLEKLQHFVGAYRAGSIRRYAQENSLSQPGISKSIQNLETALEASLFTRSRNGVSLTASGRTVLEFAERTIAESSILESKLRAARNIQFRGSFRIGTYQSIAVYFMPKLFQFMRREHKDLDLQFVTAPSSDLAKAVRNGSVDAILSINPPNTRDLVQTLVFEDSYSLYRKTGDKFDPKITPIFTLATATDRNGKSTLKYLSDAKLSLNVVSCGDFESAKAMVDQGAGVAFMPERVAAPLVKAGRLEAINKMNGLRNVGAHDIVFSCRSHRQADQMMLWIREQILLMLRSEL